MTITLSELTRRADLRRELPSPGLRRAIRREAGVSAADLARFVGVTEAAVCHWERGTREPRGENLERYAAALQAIRGEPL